jgi:hypothetical protein
VSDGTGRWLCGCLVGLPIFWEAQRFSFGEADEGELLAAGDEGGVIIGAKDFEGAPEADALDGIEVAADMEDIAEACGFVVIGFGAEEDGEFVAVGHIGEGEAKFGAEAGAGGLDEAEVGEVVDDPAGICIKEHDLFLRLYCRCCWHGG